jgi:hypothetical protein
LNGFRFSIGCLGAVFHRLWNFLNWNVKLVFWPFLLNMRFKLAPTFEAFCMNRAFLSIEQFGSLALIRDSPYVPRTLQMQLSWSRESTFVEFCVEHKFIDSLSRKSWAGFEPSPSDNEAEWVPLRHRPHSSRASNPSWSLGRRSAFFPYIWPQHNSIFLGRSASGPIGPSLFHFYIFGHFLFF